MACKRSAVRSRLPPPNKIAVSVVANHVVVKSRSPSSRGLGHRPFTAVTGVRIPVGTPEYSGSPSGPRVWGYSSAGRALAWHARGQRFDPAYLHQTDCSKRGSNHVVVKSRSPSSRGLGHRPFTAVTGVRIPVGTPTQFCVVLSRFRHLSA